METITRIIGITGQSSDIISSSNEGLSPIKVKDENNYI